MSNNKEILKAVLMGRIVAKAYSSDLTVRIIKGHLEKAIDDALEGFEIVLKDRL